MKYIMTTVQDLEQMLGTPVSQWHTLISINLSLKNITNLPPEVKFWTAAQTINLSENQLQSLPNSI